MLDKQIIKPTKGPWVSPMVFVRKKDGSSRFCVDYLCLNLMPTPFPAWTKCLGCCRGANTFLCWI